MRFHQGFFVAYSFEEFPLILLSRNLRKCAIRVFLPNLPKLGSTGTFGAAVSSRILCDVCTSGACYLEDDGICARVFL